MQQLLADVTPLGAFSAEQKEYLEGFLGGVAQRAHLPFVGVTADGKLTSNPGGAGPNLAAEETFYSTKVADLCKEERWKYEENPLDAWDRMMAHAEKEQFPDAENTYRFKFFGLFYVAPAQNAFMLRCRLPAGILTSVQAHGMAEIATDWGGGYLDITTRANLQVREIAPRHLLDVLGKIQDLGISSRGAGADNVRNITASPASGIDPVELYDCRLLARGLNHYLLNHRELFGLPRKFNVAFDGGGSISALADTNDIGFVAVRVSNAEGIEPGVYFRTQLAGISGHKQFARDAGILVKPNDCIAVAAAMTRVFAENGDRTNRKKARLKYLIDCWGIEKFLEETEKRLAFPLTRLSLEKCELPRTPLRHGHVGVYRQIQKGKNYVGVAIPVGRMKAKQLHRLAELAQLYGSGELRLTVFQNLIIPDISDAFVETVKRTLVRMGFHHEPNSITSGMVACTGSMGCKYAATNTKGHAQKIALHLQGRVQVEQPINIHLTGCPHSCAQHYIGDIGLLGTKVNPNGESVEGYHVVLGGGFGADQAVGREVFSGIAFPEIPPLLERILRVYEERRESGESFSAFTRRHDIKTLQEIFSS